MFAVTLFIICYFVYSLCKITCGKNEGVRCLVGKTAIVTGGNAGIGYQTCLNLASRGCRVIIADMNDSEESKQQIIKATNNPNIISKKLNLASFRSVREFVDDIKKTEEKLDILVNNAGTAGCFGPTEDGFNQVMQINYFGPFLLTCLLIDLLKKSAPSRIIFTSSVAAFVGDLDINLKVTESARGYCNSKLATIVISDIFAKKLKSTGVTSNSLHPGLVRTDIYKTYQQTGFIAYCMALGIRFLNTLIGKTPWEGAQTTIHLATSEKLDNVTGKYFWDCHEFPKPWKVCNEKAARHLWEATENYVKLLPHEKI